MSNVVPFPGSAGRLPRPPAAAAACPPGKAAYEFSPEELDALCRWYSAMRWAFPHLEAVIAVYHREQTSAIGLYGEGGKRPSCLISKHMADDRTYVVFATDCDTPRIISGVSEITEAQIGAIEPPADETLWMDEARWSRLLADCLASDRAAGEVSPRPA